MTEVLGSGSFLDELLSWMSQMAFKGVPESFAGRADWGVMVVVVVVGYCYWPYVLVVCWISYLL